MGVAQTFTLKTVADKIWYNTPYYPCCVSGYTALLLVMRTSMTTRNFVKMRLSRLL
jgi:hypothetical protein